MRRRIAAMVVATLMAFGMLGGTAFATHRGELHGNQSQVCENPGGNAPPGQQGKCQGQALDETTYNQGGNAPPGQNK
jgi:hypothetical protein